jgi:homoserine kinase
MIKVFAPASIANFYVGFDILGFAFDQVGDVLTLDKKTTPGIELEVTSSEGTIPTQVEKNTGTVALKSLLDRYQIDQGFKIRIEKGIPLSSGLGGSAASAVAAVFAANELLNLKLTHDELIDHALDGEAIASGARHADNIAPCLKGGLQCVYSIDPVKSYPMPMPDVFLVIIHPHVKLETARARSILQPKIDLSAWIEQSRKLASFTMACHNGDRNLFRQSLQDIVIEPQRKYLIPGFDDLKKLAVEEGAWGFTISGAGPSSFAICQTQKQADALSVKLQKVLLDRHNLNSDIWVSGTKTKGARVL